MNILIITAITIACLHTISGPDHYLPFIALSKSRNWSLSTTCFWTVACGLGHVGSSVLLGLGGAVAGWSFSKLTWLEEVRGGVAGWALLVLGLGYALWGWIKVKQNKPHKHFEWEQDGAMYVLEHRHEETANPARRYAVTPWVLFIIFVLGPCEPMIPLLYYPALKNSWQDISMLVAVYTVCTLFCMLAMVILGFSGFAILNVSFAARYMHVIGGIAILVCGAGMVFMGW